MMKMLGFNYDVSARVEFTMAEARALVKLSKWHYDSTCMLAGLLIGEECQGVTAHVNGFLAQLTFTREDAETVEAAWPFRYFDITLKILEQRGSTFVTTGGVKERLLYDNLNAKINKVCDAIQAEHGRLVRGGGK